MKWETRIFGCYETKYVNPLHLSKKKKAQNAHLECGTFYCELLGVCKQFPTFQSLDFREDNSQWMQEQ